MQSQNFINKGIGYQKVAAQNLFELFSVWQQNGEDVMKHTLEQLFWIPESGRTDILDWSRNYTLATDELKQFVDSYFNDLQQSFTPLEQVTNVKDIEKTKVEGAVSVGAKKAPPVAQETSVPKSTTRKKPVTAKKGASKRKASAKSIPKSTAGNAGKTRSKSKSSAEAKPTTTRKTGTTAASGGRTKTPTPSGTSGSTTNKQ